MDLPYACQVKSYGCPTLWVSDLMVVHLMVVRSYACLVDGCLLTLLGLRCFSKQYFREEPSSEAISLDGEWTQVRIELKKWRKPD